ncbi:chromosome partition protein Smc [Synergistales bacterium]|nr:chromosome partition protein Smc [Synergistales bacterium]
MSIESLRLKGFKSFGTACDFAFSEGFTAIVGPNGSGKSNILDALRWVLDDGSPRALRIERQSGLIFQGSATVNPASMAEVVLKLKQKDAEKPEPLVSALRRQYTAEDGSVLRVDDVKIRFQDLVDFKARFMLEGDSFAFIGQGDITKAIEQGPMERRRHLELLFGIDRYRKKREDTSLKLNLALTEMARITTLVTELETRRKEIAPEVAVAVEAKGILDNLENIRRDFYFTKRLSVEKKEREIKRQMQLTSEHSDEAASWKNLWLLALSAAEEKMRIEGFDEGGFLAREQELLARKDSLRRQSFSCSTKLKGILSDRAENVSETARVEAVVLSVRAELDKNKKEEREIERARDEKRIALEETLRLMEENRAAAERERMRRQTLRDEHAAAALRLSHQEAKLKALSSGGENLKAELDNLAAERASHVAAASKLEMETKALDDAYKKLAFAHSDAYAVCQKYAALSQQLKREQVRQEAELDAAKENTEGSIYPEPTRLLLSASRLGRMKSRPEVVAETFSCPPNIAPALEAYLGGRQFWLLVKTFDEAQEGIELLKQRRAGRVTYLPLETCRARFPDSRFRLPVSGVVGWAAELITPRSPWEPALQHLLGDLLIVSDYPLGSRMVKDGARFPIVTIEGEVFSPAGTVSGGRMRQSGGAISHNQKMSELAVQIDSLKRRVKETEAELSKAEKQEQKAGAESESLGASLLNKQKELQAEQKSIQIIDADVLRLESEIAAGGAEIGILEDETAALSARISELDIELNNASGASSEPSEPDKSPDSADSSVSAQKSEIDLLEERLRGAVNMNERVGRELKEFEARLCALKENALRGHIEEAEIKKQLTSFGRESFEVWGALAALRLSLAEAREKAGRLHNRRERLKSRSQKAEANVAGLAAELAALNERMERARDEEAELQEMWEEKYPYDSKEAARIASDRAEAERAGEKDLAATMRRLERDLRALGPYNAGALSEDDSLIERIDYLGEQSEDVRSGIDELQKLIAETDAQVDTMFTRALNDINNRFNALFQRLFTGGEARLTLQEPRGDAQNPVVQTDSQSAADFDDFNSSASSGPGSVWNRGVEIYAMPRDKRLPSMSLLSWGERSLIAIAYLFAAIEVARMPFAVLDEVDAALDERNVIRFSDLAKEYSKKMQLIVITHKRATMERADFIYGVTMAEPGLSKIVGIDVENYSN